MRLSDGRVENSLHRLAMLCSDPPASVEHTFARPGNDWFRLDIAVAAGLAKVGNPPTAADFHTMKDGPPSTEAVEKRICRVRRVDLRSHIAAGLGADPGTQARIVCSSGPTPMIAITRLML